ncbi:MAG: MCP four helix bundle domain-containing protein [Pseudomonadota bacterium]
MSKANHLTINAKLMAIALLALLSLAVVGGYLITRMEEVYNAVNYGNVNSVPSLKKLSQVLDDGKEYYALVIRHILNTDATAMSDLEQNLKQALKNANRGLADYEKLLSDNTDKLKLAADNDSLATLTQVIEEVLPLSRANKNDQAREILNAKGTPAIVAFQNILNDHLNYNKKLAEESSHQGEESYQTARWRGMAAIVILGILLSAVIMLISRSVIGSMNHSPADDNLMAEGDQVTTPKTHHLENALKKFLLMALLVLSSVAGLGGYLVIKMGQVYTAANYANVNSAPSLTLLSQVQDYTNDYYEYVLRHVLSTDAAVMSDVEQKLNQSLKNVRKGLNDYEALLSDYTDKMKLLADQNTLADVIQAVDKTLPLSRENKNDEARDMMTKKAVPALDQFRKALNDHLNYNMKLADAGSREGEEFYQTTRWRGMLLIGILGVLLFATILMISRSITKPVSDASAVAENMSKNRNVFVIIIPAVLWVTGISAYFALVTDQNLVQGAKQRELRTTATLIQNNIQEQANKAAARASLVVSLPSIKEAFRKGDHDELVKRLVPAFLLQRSRYGIQEGQFHYPPATSFLSLFKVDAGHGEDQSSFRDMVVKTNRDQESQKGIEIGREGISIRGVDLVRDADGIIGSFEVGLSFSTVLENIKQNSGFEASVFVEDEIMSRVATLLPKPDAEQVVGGFRNVESTDWNIMKLLVTPDIITRVNDVTVFMKTVNGMDYGLVLVPLLDYNGSQIGSIVAARNFEGYQTQMTAALVRAIAFSILQALVLSGIMIVMINVTLVRPAAAQESK